MNRGRGEQVRLMLSDIGATWQDVPEGDYKTSTTFGQLPVLYEVCYKGAMSTPLHA